MASPFTSILLAPGSLPSSTACGHNKPVLAETFHGDTEYFPDQQWAVFSCAEPSCDWRGQWPVRAAVPPDEASAWGSDA